MGTPKEAAKPAAPDDRTRLKPEEGKLAIDPPADAKAGAEAVAKITVTAGAGYHVNTEYPTKLTLTSPEGVTLAKAELVAGGHDKAKGDADSLDEKQLVFAVKLTRCRRRQLHDQRQLPVRGVRPRQCLPKRRDHRDCRRRQVSDTVVGDGRDADRFSWLDCRPRPARRDG